jgi:hypothetical protein
MQKKKNGDSHAKGLPCNLSSHFGKNFEILGRVMPGARLENKFKYKRDKNIGKK